MKHNFFIIGFVFLTMLLVYPVLADPLDPYENYIPPSINGTEPLNVTFTDISYIDATAWKWNATDVTGLNTPFTFATTRNPFYTFYRGNYSIQLTVTNASGTNTTPANTAFVNVSSPVVPTIPVANFTSNSTTVAVNQPIQFTDTSTGSPTSWGWCFGQDLCTDYSQRTTQNPTWGYYAPGNYTVSLRANNSYGSNVTVKTAYIQVTAAGIPPTARISPGGTWNESTGLYEFWIQLNQSITFQDISLYGTSRNLSYVMNVAGDPYTYYSTSEYTTVVYDYLNITYFGDPVYGYTPQYRKVSLTSSNAYGITSTDVYVIVSLPAVTPIPRITANNGTTSVTYSAGSNTSEHVDVANMGSVTFTDASLNTPTARTWTINAGNGSSYTYNYDQLTPSHTFQYINATGGYYPVTLTSSNEAGSATITAPAIIHIMDSSPPAAITGLTATTGAHEIYWNWTNPADADFSYTSVYKQIGGGASTLFENVTGNGTTWTGLTTNQPYTISVFPVDTSGNINGTWTYLTATPQSQWNWTTPGTYNWTCPPGVDTVSLMLIGGGGSGRGGSNNGGGGVMLVEYAGLGGEPGELKQYSNIPVEAYHTYQVYIGSAGTNTTYGNIPTTGSNTSAFGYLARGGAGGGFTTNNTGGNGTTAGYGTDLLAINGTVGSQTIWIGGIAGLGYGASGGGGGKDTEHGITGNSTGGRGANGYARIVISGYELGNRPDFSGSPTSSTPGTVVHFTDISTIVDPQDLVYNWSFGDAGASLTPYSDIPGDVSHVYTYLGTYDVSLTLSNVNGSVTETKRSYITIMSDTSGKINTLYPREVSFTIVDKNGKAIVDLPVTATMTSSSVDNTNWLTSMFGLADTTINTTVLSDTTDSSGQVVFPMIASGRYRMTFIDATRGINDARDVHPSMLNYIYIVATSATAIAEASADAIFINLSTSPPPSENPATIYLLANYTDLSNTTSAVTFVVRYPTNQTEIYSRTYNSTSAINFSYAVSNTMASGYIWEINATTSKFGSQKKALGVTLKGTGESGLASNLIKAGCNNWKCD